MEQLPLMFAYLFAKDIYIEERETVRTEEKQPSITFPKLSSSYQALMQIIVHCTEHK